MDADFKPKPHKEAVALIAGKKPVVKKVFNGLLPELRARAFTVAGVSGMDALQRIRDAVTTVPQGSQTWDEAKKSIIADLEPYLGDGAESRANLVLRQNTFQAYSATIHNVAQADDDTTHLQYMHGEADKPTPSHLALNGIVLPKDDPFWKTHTGPWGHIGCVCYVRPMNPDMVADEKKKDEKRNPEDRNVVTGAVATQLQHGTILRNGQRHDVNPAGPDNTGFTWNPGDMHIPLRALEDKYSPEEWNEFQTWARKTEYAPGLTVWDWLKQS